MSASVLIVCGHVGIQNLSATGLCPARDVESLRRGTGSRGEREYTGFLGPVLAEPLRARGVEVVVTDATYAAALYGRRWDLVLALHYMRDSPSSRAFAAAPAAIGVCGTRYISPVARAKAQQWVDRFHNEYPIVTGIPATPERVSDNMTHNYLWDFADEETPCVLPEIGHADVDAAVLFESGAARVVHALATITLEYLEHDLRVLAPAAPPPQPTPVPAGDPYPLASFPIAGTWDGNMEALEAAARDYSEGRAPAGSGRLYATRGVAFRIRADVALAQAMHETGRFAFGGTDPAFSARPEWNNWCGLKTTDGSATARFGSVEDGVVAHLAHLAWYAHPEHVNADCTQARDPRHFGPAHRNNVATVHDLGGKWAPSPDYGKGVARHLAEIRSRVEAWTPPAPPPPPRRPLDDIARELEELATELRTHA